MTGGIDKALGLLRRFEDGILVALLITMVGMAASQVVLRNFFDSGLHWSDSLVRVAVLWVALVGAMVASWDDSHIRIDLVSRLVLPQYRQWIERVTRLFTFAVLCLFTWGSGSFVYYEYVDQAIAFGDVPAWALEIIMPIGGARDGDSIPVADGEAMIWLGVIVILAMAALGAPLFAVLMGAAMLGFYSADIDLAIIAIELYRIVDTPLLVALPLFYQRLFAQRIQHFHTTGKLDAKSVWLVAQRIGHRRVHCVLNFYRSHRRFRGHHRRLGRSVAAGSQTSGFRG